MAEAGRILIYGAGAIGRGFLAPLLAGYGYEISFVERDAQLRERLAKQRRYRAAFTADDSYSYIEVPVSGCFAPGEVSDIEKYDLVFSAVGPNNCYDLAHDFRRARAVISCENDSGSARKLSELSGNQKIYFGIPDVITSSSAPPALLENDPLTTVSERGVLVLEAGDYQLPAEILQLSADALEEHWLCKLFIHNAPHAIIAYLGWLKGYRYIHEAMADPAIAQVVEGAIGEITEGLIQTKMAAPGFAHSYKEKELSRFRDKLLFDPIDRVAREPLRKLDQENRLVLSARLCVFTGHLPINVAIGIRAALAYANPGDEEAVFLQNLRNSTGDRQILKKHCGIQYYDPLSQLILDQDISEYTEKKQQGAGVLPATGSVRKPG